MRVYLNGDILDSERAAISPFDRGFLFGDGVYEAVLFFNRVGVGMDLHVERLGRSLGRAGITGFDPSTFHDIARDLLADSGIDNAMIYLQVTRGVQMPRKHLPGPRMTPTVFAYANPVAGLESMREPQSIRCVIVPDDRWAHCAIKSTSLIANVLAGMEGARCDADEVIQHRGGWITEGAMSNVFVVRRNVVLTPPDDAYPSILSGVMRRMLLDAAAGSRFRVEVRPVHIDEVRQADEAFITSSRRLLDAVTSIDGSPVGAGVVGPVTRGLFDLLRARVAEQCAVHLQSCP